MASNDLQEPTLQQQAKARLRQIVDAQMWAQVEHVYVTPELTVLTGGSGMAILDADGFIVGLSPDLAALGLEVSKDSVSYELAHPAPVPEPIPTPEPEVALTEEEQHAMDRDLLEWSRQFDPVQQRKAKAALWRRGHRLLGLDPSRPAPHQAGRPHKYTRFGSLAKYAVPREAQDAQPIRSVEPTGQAGQVEPE